MPPPIEPVDNDAATVTNTPQTLAPTTQAAAPSDAALTPSQSPSTAPQPAQAMQATSMQATAPTSPAQVTQGAQVQQPAQPSQAMVTNTPPSSASNPHANNPLVQRASVFRAAAESLTGGPQYRTTIDPDTGASTRTRIPVSTKALGLTLALEALSGGLAGLSAKGPNAKGEAAAIGLQQGQQIAQQRQQAEQEQAKQANADYQRKASITNTNIKMIAALSESEMRGAEAIDKLAQINRESGILDIAPEYLDNGGQSVTQADALAGMRSGKYNSTDMLGPINGRTEVTNADGSRHWEATHLLIRDPNTKITLTPEMYQRYSEAGVPGYPKTSSPIRDTQVPLHFIADANETVASHYLADQRLKDLKTTLAGTPLADQVPTSIDFTKPGVATALSRFRFYVSHNADNLADPYAALQAMGTDRRNPQTGAMQPNPDARYVDTIASTFGGWPLLQAAHDQIAVNKANSEKFSIIDSPDKANAVVANPKRFTPDQVASAKGFLSLTAQQGATKTTEEARARAVATGADVEAMYKFGVNPVTGTKLTLDNAPDSMLVTPSGVPVPQNQQSLWKPSAQEKSVADTAQQALAISADLRKAVTTNPNIVGPLLGRSEKGLANAGLGTKDAQDLLNKVGLLQSAIVKAHTGRMSDALLTKANGMVNASQNAQQFLGGLDGVDSVMRRYANEGNLRTVADYRAEQAATAAQAAAASAVAAGVPAGATAARDPKGDVVGYKTANGQYFSLGVR